MLVLPVNEPVKVIDCGHVAGTNCVEITFRFSEPVSTIYLRGGQVAKYDDIAATAQYELWEGLGVGDPYISNTSGDWSNALGSTVNLSTLSTVSTPGYDGCAVYVLKLNTTATAGGVFDFVVLGVK